MTNRNPGVSIASLVFLSILSNGTLTNPAPADGCAGTGTSTGRNGGWMLDCTGSCGGEDCEGFTTTGLMSGWSETNGSDATGDYWVCVCGEESECCHYILYKDPGSYPHEHTPGWAGDCPSCPLPGTCQLNAGETQAFCGTPL